MAEENRKSPVGQLAELFVYAPLGAVAYTRDALPELVVRLAERGRQEAENSQEAVRNQLALARSLVQAAVGAVFRGSRRPAPAQTPGPAAETGTRAPKADLDGESAIREAQSQVGRVLQEAGRRARTARDAAGPKPRQPESRGGAGPAGHLAIPDYESLSAAQVNARLGALSPEELAAVRDFEESHRGRRSVLSRVDALLSS